MLLFGVLLIALLAILLAVLLTRPSQHIPSDIYIPQDSYECTSNSEFSVCSGNGYDDFGNQWTAIDRTYYQERSPEDTRRMINMTLTNGTDIYLLEGSGRGENVPNPTGNVSFTFAVTNRPGLNARLQIRVINAEEVYVVSFFAQ